MSEKVVAPPAESVTGNSDHRDVAISPESTTAPATSAQTPQCLTHNPGGVLCSKSKGHAGGHDDAAYACGKIDTAPDAPPEPWSVRAMYRIQEEVHGLKREDMRGFENEILLGAGIIEAEAPDSWNEKAITRVLSCRQEIILAAIFRAQKRMNASGGLRSLERWEARLEELQAMLEAFKKEQS